MKTGNFELRQSSQGNIGIDDALQTTVGTLSNANEFPLSIGIRTSAAGS